MLLLAQSHAGQKGDIFGPVVKDIDGFLADLKKEEEADMAEKAMCEKERSERTQRCPRRSWRTGTLKTRALQNSFDSCKALPLPR